MVELQAGDTGGALKEPDGRVVELVADISWRYPSIGSGITTFENASKSVRSKRRVPVDVREIASGVERIPLDQLI